MFQTIKEKHYPDCRTITRVSGVKFSKEQEFSAIENFWKRYVDQVAFVDYNPWENIYDSLPSGVSEACSDLWRRMFVWWDGKVNPCDYDYKSVLSKWNVNQKSIKDIWNSEEYNLLRKKHLEKKRNTLEPCKRCFNA
jgi:radical SAM protein with 4Fe4S-binding SPASM domain